MEKENIKKLQKVSVKEFWEGAEDFSTWLSNNIYYLEETVGEQLELIKGTEYDGSNIVNILAKSTREEENRNFCIMCSLKKSTNRNLHQIRELIDKKELSVIIFIATRFSAEQLNKIDNVNRTNQNSHVRPLKMELFKVQESNIFAFFLRELSSRSIKGEELGQEKENWIKRLEVFIWQ
ncbi:hypothetical protein KGY79_02365 [Candidatus Bipolaricaulota bacterium]|nr:hypothetical protein [Candidatus Bipolaricaulota bacterium]